MQTIGLLGGMTWESTQLYYQLINQGVASALGGRHSAQIAMVSVDFDDLGDAIKADDWDHIARRLTTAARQVEAAGADFLLLCTNTMHMVADQIQDAVDIPLLHLADAAGEAVTTAGLSTIGLLGTRATMEKDFYVQRLRERHGLSVLTPGDADRGIVDDVIFDELVHGNIRESSRSEYLRIMGELVQQGAQGILEGCTEIVLLVDETHTDIPLFDTTAIHAAAAVKRALS